MALFKIHKGLIADLEKQPKKEGYAYVAKIDDETAGFFVDYDDNTRLQVGKYYGLVTSSENGLVPKFNAASGTIDNSSNDWVLTSNNGSLGWYRLPANAFKNDNTNTTYTLSGAASGNTWVTTLTPSSGTATKSTVPAATTTAAGLMTPAMVTKLNSIAEGATANNGDITGVTAGNGLSGGATSGNATLSAKLGLGLKFDDNKNIVVNTDYVPADKNYAVKTDASGALYVNVPWSDTNTHYTTRIQTGASQATTNATNPVTNPYITVTDSNTYRSQIQLKGAGSTTVSADDGIITITSTNTTYSAYTGASSAADGSTGLVPKPLKGQEGWYLRGDGKWFNLTEMDGSVQENFQALKTAWESADTSLKSTLTTLINGKAPTNHAASSTSYGISTDSLYGHAMASSTAPKASAATAVVGSETAKFARGDHVHPLSVSNAWSGGQTAGPKVAVTVNGVTATAVSIPTASGSASGAVIVGNQTFGGFKHFNTGEEVHSTYKLGSYYNYTSGYLIDIGAAKASTMVVIHITGNTYSSADLPINSLYQFYDYGSGSILQPSGLTLGANLGNVSAYRYNDRLYAYISQPRTFCTLNFTIYSNKSDLTPTVTNSTMPSAGTSDLTTITPKYMYNQATSSTAGLVKIGYAENGKNYPVELNSSGQMYVNVPWTDTNTDTGATSITVTGSGNAITSASYDATTRKITLTKGATYNNFTYTHPTFTAQSSGLYKITVNGEGHVSAVTAVTKADITGLGIPGSNTNTTYTFASGSTNGAFTVTPSGGSAQSVTIYGLKSAAYKDAVSTNTASTVVLRDSSGNFSAGTITATLSGNASTASVLKGATSSSVPLSNGGAGYVSYVYNVIKDTAGNPPDSSNANGVLTLNTHSGNYYHQLAFSSNNNLYHRAVSGTALTTSTGWNRIMTSNQAIPYIVGPTTDTTAGTWTGTCEDITAYVDGLTIIYVPKVAGASTTTLNINGLGAKTCYYTNSSKLTTHFSVNTPIMLTYIGGTWKRADYDSNTNTQIRVYRQTSGYNGDYPILVSRTALGSIGTAGTDSSYTSVYGVIGQDGAKTPTINPHTGVITAPGGFNGNLSGHATSAGRLTSSIVFTPAETALTPANVKALIGTGSQIRKGSWSYAGNGYIASGTTATSACPYGAIDLAGTTVIQSETGSQYTQIYITPPTASTSGAIKGEMLYYIDQGTDYTPTWYRVLTDKNYTAYAADRTAIVNITRSGTTFTATRANGTTFTFTQQDNNSAATLTLKATNSAASTATIGTYAPSAAATLTVTADHLFPIYTSTKTAALALNTWTDMTIPSSLTTGTYVIQVTAGGVIYSGVMSWDTATTTASVYDEVLLHSASSSGAHVTARVNRTDGLKLQLCALDAAVASGTITVKMRRII